MALVEVDFVVQTLIKEAGVCFTLGQRKEARGIYGAIARLLVLHSVKQETLRQFFSLIKVLPEGYAHAELILLLATDNEKLEIAWARTSQEAITRAKQKAFDPLPPLLS